MSAHDGLLFGVLNLAPGLAVVDAKPILRAFLAGYGYTLEQACKASWLDYSDSITFDLPLQIRCMDYDKVDNLADELGQLGYVGVIQLRDYDTGDPEDALNPYFVGPDEVTCDRLQCQYGLDIAKHWIEPLLGEAGFEVICQQCLSAVAAPSIP
ncbi:hypothetical protein [Parachitinimonas caeni]|uniref:Uncharacterized protein n=1 Tax=Parachitinimonas caeni TaxID=3031301 RepID=A0ABT7E380_9NEIS|nr:hypothetical protein [Parachitinimonas caeni]MDK2126766.1 hypothetical protein [Parachitinimonas caeni]